MWRAPAKGWGQEPVAHCDFQPLGPLRRGPTLKPAQTTAIYDLNLIITDEFWLHTAYENGIYRDSVVLVVLHNHITFLTMSWRRTTSVWRKLDTVPRDLTDARLAFQEVGKLPNVLKLHEGEGLPGVRLPPPRGMRGLDFQITLSGKAKVWNPTRRIP